MIHVLGRGTKPFVAKQLTDSSYCYLVTSSPCTQGCAGMCRAAHWSMHIGHDRPHPKSMPPEYQGTTSWWSWTWETESRWLCGGAKMSLASAKQWEVGPCHRHGSRLIYNAAPATSREVGILGGSPCQWPRSRNIYMAAPANICQRTEWSTLDSGGNRDWTQEQTLEGHKCKLDSTTDSGKVINNK